MIILRSPIKYFSERDRDEIDASIGGILGGGAGLVGVSGYKKFQKNLLHNKKEVLREKIREERNSLGKLLDKKNKRTKTIDSLNGSPSPLTKGKKAALTRAKKDVKAIDKLVSYKGEKIKGVSNEIKSAIKKASSRNKVAKWALPVAGATLGAALSYGLGHEKKD